MSDGCCTDGAWLLSVWNRPGLSQLAYRIGDHAAFKNVMLARLSARDLPALRGLTRRDDADQAIALLDAAAVLADSLTFHQERIANESWLRTATERRSLVALGRLIGYEPSLGLAATAHLAFTLLDADPTFEQLLVPAGTRVQSVPVPGARPVVFETTKPIDARPEWNAMRPVTRQPHPPISATTAQVRVAGLRGDIQRGETILLVSGSGTADRTVKRVVRVIPDPASQATRLDLADQSPTPPFQLQTFALGVFELTPQKLTNEAVSASVLGRSWQISDLAAFSVVQDWGLVALRRNIQAQRDQRTLPPGMGVQRFARNASIFGHNAPRWDTLAPSQRLGEQVKDKDGVLRKVSPAYPASKNWDEDGKDTLAADVNASGLAATIDLDDRYPDAIPGSWLVLTAGKTTLAANITNTAEAARADFTLNAKVTRLGLDASTGFKSMRRREVVVHLASEQLVLAPTPVTDVVMGNEIVLDSAYLGLRTGRPVAVAGLRADLDGVQDAEVAEIADVTLVDGLTRLRLVRGLRSAYVRSTVTINANVAQATHGHSQAEAIGSGDARQAFQRFPLRQPPLTYVPAGGSTGTGLRSTLTVRVGQELWTEVPNLFGAGPHDKVFFTAATADGGTVIGFGDGTTGARLPTGLENVRASYRQGSGADGLVGAGALTLPLVRPPGVRAVTNPEAAADAADPEGPDSLRASAPLRVKTLDRIVSMQDYGDYAAAYAGIAKAWATWTWDGRVRGVFLTVAGPDGRAIDPGGKVASGLLTALRDGGDPRVPLRIATYRPAFFRLAGALKVAPALDREGVGAAAVAALRGRFSFGARGFGVPVALSEVLAAIHAVPGVVAFDPSLFARSDEGTGVAGLLPAAAPRAGEAAPLAAELLLLDPRPIRFEALP